MNGTRLPQQKPNEVSMLKRYDFDDRTGKLVILFFFYPTGSRGG